MTIPALACAESVLTLSYELTVAGLPVGSIAVDARFGPDRYMISVTGQMDGVSRSFGDVTVRAGASGGIIGERVYPHHFELDLIEPGLVSSADIAFRDRAVRDLHVEPGLTPSLTHVPLTIGDVQSVVDPVSGLFVPIDHNGAVSGAEACARTINVFDGWQRYDLVLSYATTRTVMGARDGYAGPVHVCDARYYPISGHQLTSYVVDYMAVNERLEASLFLFEPLRILIPYQLLIGTDLGDAVLRLDRMAFVPDQDAPADGADALAQR